MPVVICQEWEETENEPGWGVSVRPDGFSLHLSQEHRTAFIKEFNAKQSKSVGGWSRAEGQPYYVKLRINSKMYKELMAAKNGKFFSGKAPEGFLKINSKT